MIFHRGRGSATFKEAREEGVSCRHVCGKRRVKLWRLFTRESFSMGGACNLKNKGVAGCKFQKPNQPQAFSLAVRTISVRFLS